MQRQWRPVLLALCLSCLLWPWSVAALDVPPNDGFVTDNAGIFTPDQEQELEHVLKLYQEETSNEIAVLFLQSLEGEVAADFAVRVGRKWGVGTGENDNGIVMLASYEDREIFVAVGYGLEGAVPDIVVKGIIDTDIVPRFKDGQYYEGFVAGIEAIQAHIGGEYTSDRYESGGGDTSGGFVFLFYLLVIAFEFFVAFLGRTKSWWLGGMIGAAIGIVLTIWKGLWLLIPLLTFIGFVFDFIVSRGHKTHRRRWRNGTWWGGGRGGSGGSSSGGFGGFSGGSFGGGGAGGRW